MKSTLLSLLLLPSLVHGLSAAYVERPVSYLAGETACEGVLVYDASVTEPKPAVLMVPNWMGVTEPAVAKAKMVAGTDYVVFVADMYGVDTRPADASGAGAAAGAVRSDRGLMRTRAAAALEAFLQLEGIPVDRTKVGAIGFCFGGGTVLEFGRAGADLDAIVSFHGDLESPTLEAGAGATKARVLVLHGADDPYVPETDVARFITAMRETEVDWQFVHFGGTVHSFTNPQADTPGQADYNEQSATRAFALMHALFTECWDRPEAEAGQ